MLYELNVFAKKFREIAKPFQEALEKIGGQIEAATTEYKAERAKSESSQVITTILHRPQSEIDSDQAYDSRLEGRDRVRLVVECLALGLGGILAIATIGQWIVTRQSVSIAAKSAEAAERGAAASEEQVKATRASIEATVETFRTDQRAWVGPVEMGINDPPIHVGSKLVATIVLTNSGKTPALNVETLASIVFVDKSVALNPRYKVDTTDQPSNSAIQPGMKEIITTLPVGSPSGSQFGTVSTTDLAEIESGKSIVYVFGKITYQDVFNTEHRTTFCGFLNRNLTTLRACKTYNHAD